MGVRIITGTFDDGEQACAVLYCSTTMTAFGPIFQADTEDEASDDAQSFCEFLEADARKFSGLELEKMHALWSEKRAEERHLREKDWDKHAARLEGRE